MHCHDQLSRDTFASILGLNSLYESAWQQVSLKIKLGGFRLEPNFMLPLL